MTIISVQRRLVTVSFCFESMETCKLTDILATRFSQLKSLNLSHNRLGEFPLSLCEISTLTELNVSCNGLHCLPTQIGKLLKWVYISFLCIFLSLVINFLSVSVEHSWCKGATYESMSAGQPVLPWRLNGTYNSSRGLRTKTGNKACFSFQIKISQYFYTFVF